MSLLLLLLHSLAHFDAIILLSIILDYRCIRVKELKKKKKVVLDLNTLQTSGRLRPRRLLITPALEAHIKAHQPEKETKKLSDTALEAGLQDFIF